LIGFDEFSATINTSYEYIGKNHATKLKKIEP